MNDGKTISTLATTVASTAGAGSMTVATITTPAPGILYELAKCLLQIERVF